LIYEPVCLRIEQDSAQPKNVDCLNVWVLGPSLAPDVVTSKPLFLALFRGTIYSIKWFRRDDFCGQNKCAHRFQHIRLPQNTDF
ncbi:hypothetical protein PMAYCL1PPCAC_31609, partial [Pristionchus mayeri]